MAGAMRSPRPASGAPWWSGAWQAWQRRRDRWLADPAFRRWSSGFLPTRAIARRRASELFDLVAGFVYSQVLLACVRLEVFDRLADGPMPVERIASATRLPPDAAERLVDAAIALRLLESRGTAGVGLGPLGAALVGNRAIVAMVEHHAALYGDLADPVALLRRPRGGTALASFWPYAAGASPDAAETSSVAAYSALMSASQSLVADEILDAYPVQRHRCLLDVGGGEGRFAAAAARRAPDLQLMLFDLPPVAAAAQAHFAAIGLAGRAQAIGGDFHRGPLPRGADLVSLVRVVHDHDDAAALQLLRAVHAALPAGGTVLIGEPMAGVPGARRVGDAYFGLYLFAMGSGRPRRADELARLLVEAGFGNVRSRPTRVPLQCSVITARRS